MELFTPLNDKSPLVHFNGSHYLIINGMWVDDMINAECLISEAIALSNRILSEYPQAFIIFKGE